MAPYSLLRWLLFTLALGCAGMALAQNTPDTPGGLARAVKDAPVACNDTPGRELSSQYLRRVAECLYSSQTSPDNATRLALVNDLYIKSWSYSILNKLFFWLSIGLAVLVLIWPALGSIFGPTPRADGTPSHPPNRFQRAVSAPAVQTSITALAAFSFAVYAHYKEKQAVSETLMRQVIFVETLEQDQIDTIVLRLSEMDRGFGFAGSPSDLSPD